MLLELCRLYIVSIHSRLFSLFVWKTQQNVALHRKLRCFLMVYEHLWPNIFKKTKTFFFYNDFKLTETFQEQDKEPTYAHHSNFALLTFYYNCLIVVCFFLLSPPHLPLSPSPPFTLLFLYSHTVFWRLFIFLAWKYKVQTWCLRTSLVR